MAFFITVEEAYRNSTWCRKILQGISLEVLKKKIDPVFVSQSEFSPALFQNEDDHILLLGASCSWTTEILQALQGFAVRPILITNPPLRQHLGQALSRCVPDYSHAVFTLVQYMQHNKHCRMALFGINPDSASDLQKEKEFLAACAACNIDPIDAGVFYNYGNAGACFSSFLQRAEQFDAVLCANDFLAITAIKGLSQAGLCVPEDFFVASFTDSAIGRLFSPAITSVATDYVELGRQTVKNYAFLRRHSSLSSISTRLTCTLTVRETSKGIIPPTAPLPENVRQIAPPSKVDFYSDSSIADILMVEKLLIACDKVDTRILYGLLSGEVYRDIALRCFVSEETVKYRIRKLLKLCGGISKKELVRRLQANVLPDALL